MMRNWIAAILTACLCMQLPIASGQAVEEITTPPKVGKRVESLIQKKILPAYQMSDRLQLLKGLSSATARMKPEQIAALDQRLELLAMPTAGKMMVDAYMSLLTQGQGDSLPLPQLREILVMVPALDESIKEVLDAIDESVATIDPLPRLDSLEDYEGLFWDIHVLENKITNSSHFARYGVFLIEHAKKQRSRGFEEQLEKLTTNFDDRVQDLEAAHIDLQQRKLEFRLDRMELAKKTLGEAGKFMEKLQAAFVGQLDGAMFQEVFNVAEPPVFQRDRLRDPQLQQNVENLVVQIDALSGDLKKKSRLFFQGAHWWLRGRYGRGTEQNGLLKNMRVVNDQRFLFPLFIPETMGKPAYELIRNPEWRRSGEEPDDEVLPYVRVKNGNNLMPDYPRRHHIDWMFEYRQIGPVIDVYRGQVSGMRHSSTTTRTSMSDFY